MSPRVLHAHVLAVLARRVKVDTQELRESTVQAAEHIADRDGGPCPRAPRQR
jgi:hypothetical protein